MKFERRSLLRATTAATLVSLHPAPAWPSSYTSVGVPGYGVNREYALVTTAAGTRCLVCCDPSVDRGYFAACVSCGSLDDGPIEGLAHLAEHMTLASDPAGLASFIDGRQGEVNAFTGERTTTFYAQFDLDSERGLDVEIGDGLRRFAALFAAARSELPKKRLLRQEISRVDAEMRDILRAPSRGLVEVASLKARTEAASTWSRLGRGDATTLLGAQTVRHDVLARVEFVKQEVLDALRARVSSMRRGTSWTSRRRGAATARFRTEVEFARRPRGSPGS